MSYIHNTQTFQRHDEEDDDDDDDRNQRITSTRKLMQCTLQHNTTDSVLVSLCLELAFNFYTYTLAENSRRSVVWHTCEAVKKERLGAGRA